MSNRFELLVQSVTDYAICMLDRGGIVSSWNAGARRFKGYEAEEIIGRHFSCFYTEADLAAKLPARALQTAEREGKFEAEAWRVRKDGRHFWAHVIIDPVRDHDGALIGFAKITRDLTERRATEEAFRQSEERFRLLVHSVTDYAIYMLDLEGIVSSWNAGAQRAKGYLETEIIGHHFSRFYTEEDRADGMPERALRTAASVGRFEAEGWRLRKDGSRFWANVVIDSVRDTTGKLIGFAKITRDLTERREAQRALEEAQKAVFQSQKMDAIGRLTGGVAHDFNNLLSVVIGSMDLAKRRLARHCLADGPDIARFMENAIQAAQRGATLTQRMLSFARKQELTLAAVDVAELAREMAEMIQLTVGAEIAVEMSFPADLAKVRADAAQLELAILNLAVNARDAMPEGGRIFIGARELRVGEGRLALAPGQYVCLTVRDTGEGMDSETLARATEPFYTTKGLGKGTGLGLSMIHGFAEQCGGMLTLESRVGKGTSALIWLPAADANAVMSAPSHRPAASAAPCRPRLVLAVDDDQLVLTNTTAILQELGHSVLQASSGKEALALLRAHPIELLITDYSMPRMNGLQLVEAVREAWPGLPVILVSGYNDIDRAAAGGLPKLRKPFGSAELGRRISEVLAQRP